MLFNSVEFLFFFVPVTYIGFLLFRKLGKTKILIAWLTAASLFFYAWWNPAYLPLLLLSAGVNYAIGKLVTREGEHRSLWLAVGILFNVGLLGYFKYANFLIGAVAPSFNFQHIILPLAISFYTFEQISYLVDTSKGSAPSYSLLEYLLFVSFFPHLIAGPIVSHTIILQFRSLGSDTFRVARNLAIGGSIFAIGLFKKVVVADSLSGYVTPTFDAAARGDVVNGLDSIASMFSYTFQLYFDFSGYSDMAIGLSCLLGIKLPVNFFSPYRAQNISDFWRMWHATLGRFLRDYIYSPLGGFLCSPNRQRFNLFITMFVGGVWHGAGWTFVLYGAYHGFCMVVHQLWRVKVSGPLGLINKKPYRFSAQVFTFLIVALSLTLFRSDSVAAAGQMYRSMLGFGEKLFDPQHLAMMGNLDIRQLAVSLSSGSAVTPELIGFLALALAACWLLPSTQQLFKTQNVMIDKPIAGRAAVIGIEWQPSKIWATIVALLIAWSFMNLYKPSEFLYFQF